MYQPKYALRWCGMSKKIQFSNKDGALVGVRYKNYNKINDLVIGLIFAFKCVVLKIKIKA